MKSVVFWIQVSAIAISSIFYFGNSKTSFANTTTRLDNLSPIEIYVPPPETNRRGICSKHIEGIVDRILERPSIQESKWGILIQTIGGETLYSRNPDSYMIPASNIKLLVTAAALQKLNPQGKIRSSSIRDWIIATNLRSDNGYADVLLRYLGGYSSVQEALSGIGVDPGGYRMQDGSGLSRKNLATPRTLVTTLRAMHTARGKDIFLTSLPIAGETGTLKDRLRYTSAQGTVRAKTGTLRGVRALSGYADTPNYGTIAFSAIANQPTNRSDTNLVKALDEIVLRVSTVSSCQ
ncbi:Peptidase S13 D-Ala-D-Ala carboxypeptidase C [Hyella patelloides LEGE 07179]|uniref:Peptidase S13 D-Ala-D-Ala carboxypeptidase C n=1 Tax=Hyella patelloides LEGE 07179 TaxID=945734 RepID=A0A563VMX0_9CYAN|nr:D-alanyl-D-alanine carboxypeptidase [Hyella patelloides]VEP12800.1 Peptidase S13 D-Ala-D-Ala carboxypeptidase C [Hyella patelloides LEGE 07179]